VKRETKTRIVTELENDFAGHGTFYLVDFKRMNVAQSVELRKLIRKSAYRYRVIKNRLALRALQGRCPEELRPLFEKPTAIAFAAENPIGLAKILKDFSAQGKVLAVKAGVLEGQYLAPGRFDEIARLTSRQDLVAKIGFLMAAPLTRFLRSLQAPMSQMGRALGQMKNRKQDGKTSD
jgi:large subunit ribosomal protein L10